MRGKKEKKKDLVRMNKVHKLLYFSSLYPTGGGYRVLPF